ncbi:hypothetical protein LIER_18714 [Lithospermum erythrorhizon]|uniref:Polyketide cyclase/dehydrase and lipid transport superfamily protein n=1 Tax=Lithospermum erythrorhizon TaxID=34254 RepID=A0AAV3QGP4_LITER
MAKTILHFLLVLAFCHTIVATENWKVNLSAKINGPTADEVWPYVADFCNLYKIYPSSVSFCDKGTEGRPGLFRYSITIAQSPSTPNATVVAGWVREELVKISVTKKYVAYEMHENTGGITMLKASMQVVPSGNKGCTFKWNIEAAPIAGFTYKLFADSFEASLTGMVALIQSLF